MDKNTPESKATPLEPPQPRTPGVVTRLPANEDETALVAEIAAENAHDALDELYEHERAPESPMLVIGDEKRHWYHFLQKPKFWLSFVAFLTLLALFAWLLTPSRLWLLNTVGLRAQLNLGTVVGVAEGTPPILKNSLITINGRDYRTDDKGKLHVSLPYGPAHVVVSKPGYETITKDFTLDFDPFFYYFGGKQTDQSVYNQTFIMKSVGITVRFVAKDWLTGQPVTTGHYAIGDVVTTPNAKGEVSLLIPATDAATAPLTATFDSGSYTNTTVDVALGNDMQDITFVPFGSHYFISKRSGQFAVYSSNIDGTHVKEVVPAASAETGDITFSVSPSGAYGILASTREATRDTFGSIQQKLYVVDVQSNKLTPLDTAITFDIADWSGDTVVYTARYRDSSGATTERLASITASKAQQTVATDPGFKAVRVRLGSILYLQANGELKTAKLDGSAQKSLGTGITKITQTDANLFAYRVADTSWRQYDVNAGQVATIATPAALDRAFLGSPSKDGQSLLVADAIDGKPVLLAKAVGNGAETKLFTGDFASPIRWIGNVVVYRVGSADYAVAPGAPAKKITDVAPTQSRAHDYFDFN